MMSESDEQQRLLIRRIVMTAGLVVGFMAVGFATSLHPSNHFYFNSLMQSPFVQVTRRSTSQLMGSGSGGLLIGVVMKTSNHHHLTVVACLVISAVAIIVVPFIHWLPLSDVSGGILAFFTGGVDCAFKAWIIELWSSNPGPFLQALNFAFSLGTIAASLVTWCLLPVSHRNSLRSMKFNSKNESETLISPMTGDSTPSITAACVMVVPLTVTLLHLLFSRPMGQSSHVQTCQSFPSNLRHKAFMLLSFLVFLVIGMTRDEDIHVLMLPLMVGSPDDTHPHADPDAGRILFASITLTAVILVLKVSNNVMLYAAVFFTVLANIIIFLNISLTAMFLAAIITSLGHGVMRAGFYGFLSQRTNMTFVVCGSRLFFSSAGRLCQIALNERFNGSLATVTPVTNLIVSFAVSIMLWICCKTSNPRKIITPVQSEEASTICATCSRASTAMLSFDKGPMTRRPSKSLSLPSSIGTTGSDFDVEPESDECQNNQMTVTNSASQTV